MNLTPAVIREDTYKFLIKIDGQDYIYADSLDEAIMIARDIATERIREIWSSHTETSIHVFRQDLDDNKTIHVFVQKRGLFYNSDVKKIMTIRIVPLARCYIKDGMVPMDITS